jgi:hypothetical protein
MSSWREAALALALASAAAACGYRPVASGKDAGRLRVVLVRSEVADAVAADEVVSGLREALARDGALAPGSGYPRVEVEVLRADEASAGIAAPAGAASPAARGVEAGIVARAWIVPAAGTEAVHDTGDLRASDLVATDLGPGGVPDPRADLFHHADALRAAARRVGERLGLKVLGHPSVGDE